MSIHDTICVGDKVTFTYVRRGNPATHSGPVIMTKGKVVLVLDENGGGLHMVGSDELDAWERSEKNARMFADAAEWERRNVDNSAIAGLADLGLVEKGQA